ncbi:hypothetical protein GOV03_01495 [Candidatus Woesearchaeota archaeon]|nr:hypothetical protein [Candidatus Woesearchaeota archaeon]
MTENIKKSLKELVIARIEARMPSHIKLSMGGVGSMSKEEMIKHVKEGDEQGEQIVKMHLNFIKAITSGEFIRELNSV